MSEQKDRIAEEYADKQEKLHGELNDPFCYQLGFLDAYTHLEAENEKLKHTLREYNESVARFVQGNSEVATALPDCFGKNCGVVLVEYTKKIQEQNKKLKAALEFYAQKPSLFIVPEHLWDEGLRVQTKARTTLAEIGGDEDE